MFDMFDGRDPIDIALGVFMLGIVVFSIILFLYVFFMDIPARQAHRKELSMACEERGGTYVFTLVRNGKTSSEYPIGCFDKKVFIEMK